MSAQESNELTLEDIAQRLEALERENAQLRQKVVTLEGSGTHRNADEEPASESSETEPEGRMSRRRMLSRAGAAAAGLVVAGALTQRDIRDAKAATGVFDSNDAGTPAVRGTNSGGGTGVLGQGHNGVEGHSSADTGAGVRGTNDNAGDGVLGVSDNGVGIRGRSLDSAKGAVVGENLANGYGGQFGGGRAQLRLVPSSRKGRPRGAHAKGELYMDSTAALFVCVAGGTPGKWRKVTTTKV